MQRSKRSIGSFGCMGRGGGGLFLGTVPWTSQNDLEWVAGNSQSIPLSPIQRLNGRKEQPTSYDEPTRLWVFVALFKLGCKWKKNERASYIRTAANVESSKMNVKQRPNSPAPKFRHQMILQPVYVMLFDVIVEYCHPFPWFVIEPFFKHGGYSSLRKSIIYLHESDCK